MPARLVVLVSGAGTNLQALLDACADPAFGATVAAVGADRDGVEGLARAERAGVPTFVRRVGDFGSREEWDADLAAAVAAHEPDVVVLAGFMKLVGRAFLDAHGGRVVNTHPALSPSFPGMHGPAEALEYGVKVTGATLFVVDDGVDTGPIVAQTHGARGRRRHRRDAPRPDQDRRARDARRERRPDGAGGLPRRREGCAVRTRPGEATP